MSTRHQPQVTTSYDWTDAMADDLMVFQDVPSSLQLESLICDAML